MESIEELDSQLIKEGDFEYIEKGDGPVIIVLHGLFGALSNFKEVLNYFSKSFRVVMPMLPLYKMPVINTNVKALANFVHEFIEFKGYKNVHLLGNSLGGHIALVYTSKHLNNVASMILTGSSGLYENALGRSFPKRGNYDYVESKVQVTFYNPKHATKDLVDECFRVVNDKSCVIRILSLAKSAIRHNMAKELPNMNVPTCLIWGKNDTITPMDVAEEFNQLLPDSDLFWIDECGHAAMMEHPQQFNQLLNDWFKKRFNVAVE